MPSAITTRCFVYVGGGSDTFWEVNINGRSVTVRFGRTGTAGQTNSKSLADSAAARTFAEKLMLEKIRNGYTEIPIGN